jgi:hypothetical protein
MILIYKRPDLSDGYVGVMTAPHASVTWVISIPQTRTFVRSTALALGVPEPEVDEVLANAEERHFGGALRLREPANVETRQLTYPGFSLLLRSRGGYVGVVTGTPWAPRRRVRGAFRCDWVFARPISQKEVLDGMIARGRHGQDIWGLISAADENGWSYV